MSRSEIEEVYLRSQFIGEFCLLSVPSSTEAGGQANRRHAVVVPNMTMMDQRRIANVGDLLRFEIEGQSVYLPADARVSSYEIWFEPLPRTSDGAIDRQEIERRVLAQRRRDESQPAEGVTAGVSPENGHEAEVLTVITSRAKGREFKVASNLEIDLGLDSIDRVALISELERRFDVTVPADSAHKILTVQQLVDAVRPRATATREVSDPEVPDFWTTTLRDLPPKSDPVLAPLLESRFLVPTMFFILLRVARWLIPRMRVSGLAELPRRGPYIISPNHQSYLDPLFVCSTLPYRLFRQLFFVGATEYFESPLTAWAARQLSLVPVDPDANLVSAMKAAAFGMSHGRVLVLFPEGERSIDGTVKRFKRGAPILSRCLNVPVVPVAIRGVFEVWPRNRRFEWQRLLPWSGHHIQLAFGSPMRFDGRDDADAARTLQNRVRDLWGR
jgi:long-chain acyl-CoA synthetase